MQHFQPHLGEGEATLLESPAVTAGGCDTRSRFIVMGKGLKL